MAILTLFRHRFYKNDGTVNAGGKVYTYVAGTTTPTPTYTDSGAGTPNANPIILDSKGEADIWVSGQIKVNVLEADDTQVTGWPVDNVGSGVSNNDANARWAGTAAGTANALTISPSPAISAYVVGQSFIFKSGASPNSSSTTLSISGLSAIAVQSNGAACTGGEILANNWYQIVLSTTAICQISKIGEPTLAELGAASLAGSASQTFSVATPTNTAHAVNLGTLDSGWLPDNTEWTCTTAGVAGTYNADGSINVAPVSAVFTITADHTSVFAKGVKIKYTQGTVKYGYVLSATYGAGITTVTLMPNADYLMVLSTTTPITLPYFSYGNPVGFPHAFTYVALVAAIAGAFTTITQSLKYAMIGNIVHVYASVSYANIGTATAGTYINLPCTASSTMFSGWGRESAAVGHGLVIGLQNNSRASVQKYDATANLVNGYTNNVQLIYY